MPNELEAHLWTGDRGLPTLYLDDVSAIPFLVNIAGVEAYQHRARTRAGDGDLFATVTPPSEDYEEYCRKILGLGRPGLVLADPVGEPIEVARACSSGSAYERIAAWARDAGEVLLHPYMSIDPVWELAARLARDTQASVRVIGPPPPVTWIANDKKRFTELVASVLGREWIGPTLFAGSAEAIARNLSRLASDHQRVGLKRSCCASGMGNQVFDARQLRGRDEEEVVHIVREFLERTEWDGKEEVLAVAWEDTERSPSTQTWIPPRGKGAPLVEGIYEQILEGEEKVFVGSRPSGLGPSIDARLSKASLAVAGALQEIGYVGRCSFDFLVLDEDVIRFTECNGRWGGTSIPMALVDRLTSRHRPPYRAQDFVHEKLVGARFAEILQLAGDELYDPAERRGRFIFYNVGPLERSGKLDVVALAPRQEEAERAVTENLPKLLGFAG